MQKYVDLVGLVKSFPTSIFLQNWASIQKRTSPVKFAHLAEKSEKSSISNLSTKCKTRARMLLGLQRCPLTFDRVLVMTSSCGVDCNGHTFALIQTRRHFRLVEEVRRCFCLEVRWCGTAARGNELNRRAVVLQKLPRRVGEAGRLRMVRGSLTCEDLVAS